MAVEIIPRRVAVATGLARYFTGKPCKNGHIEERVVSNSSCVACLRATTRRYIQRNPDKAALWMRRADDKRRRERPDHLRQIKAKYRETHREEVLKSGRGYFVANKERYAANRRRHRAEKPWLYAEGQRARHATKMRATPSWADREAIRAVYQRAAELTKSTGISHAVDHIYPLRSSQVCGLHVVENLQILTASENSSKGNRMPDEWVLRSDSVTNY